MLSEPPAPHPVALQIGLTDEDVPSRSLWSRTRHNRSPLRSPSLHASTYGRCFWVVYDVRSGGVSSDSALPLVGSLRAKPLDVASVWDLWFPLHSTCSFPPARPCSPQLRHGLHLLLSTCFTLIHVCVPMDSTDGHRTRLRGSASSAL